MSLVPLYKPLDDNNSKTITTTSLPDGLLEVYRKLHETKRGRFQNYIVDDALKKRSLCYSVTYLEDVPVLASIAWMRPMYNGIVRLCTRYCVVPEYSSVNFGKGMDGIRLDTIDHILQQMNTCRELGYNDFFFGREDKSPRAKRTQQIADAIKKHTNIDWKVTPEPVLVAPNPSAKDCWQYAIYNNRIDLNVLETKV